MCARDDRTWHVRGGAVHALIAASFALPQVAYGAIFANPLWDNALVAVLEAFVKGVIFVAFPLFVALLVWTGFLFAAAQANPEKLTEAKKLFAKVLLGGTVLLGAWTVSVMVSNTLASLGAAALLLVLGGAFVYIFGRKM